MPMNTNRELLEKQSSAVTLSDMEIFIFPELLFSLVLANIMSPRIWEWRKDKWFDKLDRMTPYRRILRLKQFIIDHYEFNLDLETWGLTSQQTEVGRFREWIDEKTLSESNALFGYEGDRYYFDMDIRKHFGLDQYTSDTIPYWKTETVEAMDAFLFKPGYSGGAGECVSLAALYAAALFIICKVPLEDIFLMATPLHSQNFVDVKDGIITNNRRIVTRPMWFNGTELTAKAQRALRNEQVTIVTHVSGHIHVMYPEATIDTAAMDRFTNKLSSFLTTTVDMDILTSFLRFNRELQECFQVEHICHGKPRYIPLNVAFLYEDSSAFRMDSQTRDKLLADIDEYKFFSAPIEGRISLNKFEDFFRKNKVDASRPDDVMKLVQSFNCEHSRAYEIMEALMQFIHVEPRLPGRDKQYVTAEPLNIDPEMDRQQIEEYLLSMRDRHPVAGLAFHALRDVARAGWEPFMKAALERNPVAVSGAAEMSDEEVVRLLDEFDGESIYDGNRLAQPDEVWNFRRGDGLEKAICLANILKNRHPEQPVQIRCGNGRAELTCGAVSAAWDTAKSLSVELSI